MNKRTNYKQEKRLKELEKQKKKEAKKERKENRDKTLDGEVGEWPGDLQERLADGGGASEQSGGSATAGVDEEKMPSLGRIED